MFKKLEISAPGKIILCGEHAVVYSKKALASAINLRTHFSILFDDKSRAFEIKLLKLDKYITIKQDEFDSIQKEIQFKDDLNEVIVYINDSSKVNNKPFDALKFMLISLQNSLNWSVLGKMKIEIDTTIPIGSGLGSSGSFAVCLATFFLIITNKVSIYNNFSRNDLDLINKYAFFIEKIYHGNPSGIDNTVSTFGNYLIYRKGTDIETFKSNQYLPILVVNSCVPKKTSEQVMKVRNLYNKHTPILEPILEAIDNLVNKFIKILKENAKDSELNDLISVNQGLLSSLQVSNIEINTIVNIANLFGFSAKITGAGGGGCCFVLLNNDHSAETKLNLINKLKENNFMPFEVELGDTGVKIDEIEY